MATFQALVMDVDDPGEEAPKKGDIVKVAPMTHEWGGREGPPRYRVVILDDEDFYDIRNLELPITDGGMHKYPAAIRSDVNRLIRYERSRKAKIKAIRRYRVNDSNEVEDKAHGNTRVKRN